MSTPQFISSTNLILLILNIEIEHQNINSHMPLYLETNWFFIYEKIHPLNNDLGRIEIP